MSISIRSCRRFMRKLGPFELRTDLDDPASNIEVRFHDILDPRHPSDGWDPTPITVGQAGHDWRRAEEMVAEHYRE